MATSTQFVLPTIYEFLTPNEIEKRVRLIKQTEGNDYSQYENLFNHCANCQVKIWIGRIKRNRSKDEPGKSSYIFPGYGQAPTGKWGNTEPLCFKCKDQCFCTDQEYRIEHLECVNCNKSFCTRHKKIEFDEETCYNICVECKNACFCTDQSYKFDRKICQMCSNFRCTKPEHNQMYNDISCKDCHSTFVLGKQIIKLLTEKRPKTLEELYDALDQ